MRMRIAGLAVVLAIGLVAGCGGGSSSSNSTSTVDTAAFKSGFQAATAELKQGSIAIGTDITQANRLTNAQLATIFSGLAARWHTAASKLDSLNPPASAAADFATLKSASASVESDLNAIAAAAKSGDVTAAKQATSKLLHDVLAAKSAAQKVDSEVGISG